MSRSKLTLGLVALALFLFAAAGAWGHAIHQEGGPKGDTLDGHDHRDVQFGRGGCDDLLARGGWDEGRGGDSGCDTVRGMTGDSDAAIVCDDGAGNDWAYGGAGQGDICYVSPLDRLEASSCEYVRITDYHCA